VGGSASDDVYAVGEAGDIAHWDGGGWSAMESNTTEQLSGVWGAGGEVFAVGSGGAAMHLVDGTWEVTDSGVTIFLTAVAGSAANDVVAVGEAGTILHWDGATWTAMASGTTEALGDVWFAGPGDGYVVGANGTILHWDGVAWSPLASRTTVALHAVGGTGPGDVFAAGELGTILHWDGTSWAPMAPLSTRSLWAVWAGRDVFAVGAGGTMLRRPRACLSAELRCSDGDDDDCDGRIDCGDADCAADPWCQGGAECGGAPSVACGSSVAGTTIGAPRQLDAYACDAWFESGGERVYEVHRTSDGPITASLTGLGDDLDLIALAAGPTGACDPLFPGCLAASSTGGDGDETVSFPATANTSYYIVVDSFGASAGPFDLAIACP